MHIMTILKQNGCGDKTKNEIGIFTTNFQMSMQQKQLVYAPIHRQQRIHHYQTNY